MSVQIYGLREINELFPPLICMLAASPTPAGRSAGRAVSGRPFRYIARQFYLVRRKKVIGRILHVFLSLK